MHDELKIILFSNKKTPSKQMAFLAVFVIFFMMFTVTIFFIY